jgi:hypothetical protein
MLTLPQIPDFLDFLRPGFRTAIRGASPEAIAELERLSGGLLPIHHEFLLLMGEDMGGLAEGFVAADTRIEVLLEHFREGGWRPQPPFALFARDDQGGPMDAFLRWQQGMSEPELVKFTLPGEQQAIVPCGPDNPANMAPSLPAWLYRCGFINFVGGRHAQMLTAHLREPKPDDGARLDALLARRGLAQLPGGDALTGAHWAHEAAALWIRQHPADPTFVMLYSDDETLLEDLRQTISSGVSARWYMIMPTKDDDDLDDDD